MVDKFFQISSLMFFFSSKEKSKEIPEIVLEYCEGDFLRFLFFFHEHEHRAMIYRQFACLT